MQPTADGKIQHDWGYANIDRDAAQAGALPKPGEPAAAPAKGQAKAGGGNGSGSGAGNGAGGGEK